MKKLRFVGLDVHAEMVAVAVAEPGGEVRSLGTIPNRAESVRKLVRKLGPPDQLRAWDLKETSLAPDALADYAMLLSGRRLSPNGAMLILKPEELAGLNRSLRTRAPQLFE